MSARLITAMKPLACGLVWRSLAGRQPRREIAQLQRSLRATRVQRAESVAGFLAKGDLPRRTPVPRRLWSAAAMFASIADVDPTALLVLPVPEDDAPRGGDREFAVIGVHQRMPLPDFDLVLPEQRLGDEVNRLTELILDLTNDRPTLYGEGPGAVPMTWDDIATRGTAAPMEAEEARQYLLAAVAAMLAVGIGVHGWDAYQAREHAARQRERVAADPTPPYLASLDQALRSTPWNDGAAVAAIVARAGRIPAEIASFRLDRLFSCDLQQRVCTATYVRPHNGPATFAEFRAATPERYFSAVDYAFDGTRVAVKLALPPAGDGAAAAPGPGSLISEGELPLRWWPTVQTLESLPLKATLAAQPARIAGVIPTGASEAKISGLVRIWPVTANVPAWAIAGLPAIPGLTWESVELSLAAQGGVAATLKGAIYARRS